MIVASVRHRDVVVTVGSMTAHVIFQDNGSGVFVADVPPDVASILIAAARDDRDYRIIASPPAPATPEPEPEPKPESEPEPEPEPKPEEPKPVQETMHRMSDRRRR